MKLKREDRKERGLGMRSRVLHVEVGHEKYVKSGRAEVVERGRREGWITRSVKCVWRDSCTVTSQELSIYVCVYMHMY